jgi:hypothetical protein
MKYPEIFGRLESTIDDCFERLTAISNRFWLTIRIWTRLREPLLLRRARGWKVDWGCTGRKSWWRREKGEEKAEQKLAIEPSRRGLFSTSCVIFCFPRLAIGNAVEPQMNADEGGGLQFCGHEIGAGRDRGRRDESPVDF